MQIYRILLSRFVESSFCVYFVFLTNNHEKYHFKSKIHLRAKVNFLYASSWSTNEPKLNVKRQMYVVKVHPSMQWKEETQYHLVSLAYYRKQTNAKIS